MSTKSMKMKKAARKAPSPKTTNLFRSIGSPFPAEADIEFTYSTRITMDAGGSGAVTSYQFSANGMYDPDITGTGHQPLGFDQWMGTSSTTGFYNHYCVDSSHMYVTAFSQAADNTGQAVILLGLADDTTVGIDFDAARENPTYKAVMLGSVGSGHDVVKIDKGFDAAQYFGLNGVSLHAKDDLRGIYSANPAEQAYYTLYVSSDNPTVNPATVSLVILIKYRAHLTERRELLAS